jgi:hypothetical protein
MAIGDEEEVGYRKPPKKHRFKKGISGNPSGRRQGAKNFDTILAEILRRRITLTLNRETITTTVSNALVQVLIKFANGGSFRHFALALEFDLMKSVPRVIWFEKGDENL